MADIPVDGKTRADWVSTISNTSAPTVAELNAGIPLTQKITADGLMGFEPDTGEVDTTSLASTFDTKTIGRTEFSGTGLRLKKQSGTDTVYNTLVRGTEGYIVIRRDVDWDTAWTAGQAVEVYPVICGDTKRLAPEGNTLTRYEVPTPVRDLPELRAEVAA